MPSADTRDSRKLSAWLAKPPRRNEALPQQPSSGQSLWQHKMKLHRCPSQREAIRWIHGNVAEETLPRCWGRASKAAGSNHACVFSETDRCTTKKHAQENCQFSSATAGRTEGMGAILATHSTDDAALFPALAAISKGLLLVATACVGSRRTSTEPTMRRAA